MASKDTMNEGPPIVVLASRKTSRRSSDRLKFIETALINLLVATAAPGQTARIEGAVFDGSYPSAAVGFPRTFSNRI